MRLSAFVDGDLEDCCCEELSQHIDECPECARRADEMKELINLCHEVARADDAPKLSESFRSRLRKSLCTD